MLLPSPESVMGPCTASHCCCLHRTHSAMCHFQVSSHTAGVLQFFDIGCWQITGPPIAAARPLISIWPLYTASSCCCQVQSLSWVPVRPPIAAVSIATLCHVPLSGLLTLLVC
ncbi:unnamed protein product [Staurois parvus]|uniref:Uncharacterized protein n=1 Tax=Staurois parvus TaxID=386267 RepID=A0ABN9CJF5_9NEOB|nr:unnamed protein product [Staurois parvus]